MKNIIKLTGLLVLIGFSFFYTDKVIEVIREEDQIMIQIKAKKDHYALSSLNATVEGDTIIPGIKGREVNVEGSYKKMKDQGIFNENLLIYDEIDPKIRLENNQDKYIISGNHNKKMVSLIFPLENGRYLESIDKILKSNNVVANFFVDYTYLINHSTTIKEKSYHEFYSYGSNGKYTPDTILFSNNLISRITNNDATYCLISKKSKEVLELCNKNNLYTILPNILGEKTPYKNIKNNLTSGSMLLLSMNSETTNELSLIIDYIKGKGYQIVGLSNLLSE